MRTKSLLSLLSFCCLFAVPAWAQTGKIAGTVLDAETGDPLPGVNVVIDGTTQGTVTNVDGYYVILNVSPGAYTLRASYIGFTPQRVEDVRVNINQTTTVDFTLGEQVIEGEEVVVTAERPVVQPDVSASLANITSEEIETLPVSSVEGVIGLQAGIQGLSIRGSNDEEIAFMVNGLTMRNERNNTPFTSVSVTSIQEVQVQTGGFNAEYGNVRSGVINVVTKEGGRQRYSADAIIRYSPPSDKHFGESANDPNSYFIRPYLDPEVAFTGTQNWDFATRSQYPIFEGWIELSEDLLADDDPANDLTPAALQEAFRWQHRRQMEIVEPDYELDLGFGGPVPLLSDRLGGLRFYASYRREQDMYLLPLSKDRYLGQTGHVKLTSDVATGMKLSLEGMLGDVTGTSTSSEGQPGIFRSASGLADQMDRVSFIDTRIFATDYWAPTRVQNFMLGARLSHAFSASSFYELRFTRFASGYDTNPGRLRDTTPIVTIGGVGFDEAPFGFMPEPSNGVGGMRMGVGMSTARDTSRVVLWNAKADLTSQLNRFLQVKTGLEFSLTESEVDYGRFDAFLPTANVISEWERYPRRGAAYAQSKLEFQGMIANLGLRLDYSNAGGNWYDYDLFDNDLEVPVQAFDTVLTEQSTAHKFSLSPRLGVSFPVTEFSKLYFNYGHFRSLPDPDDLFLVRYATQTNRLTRIANPDNPFPKTIAYELGYEHSLFDQYLIRVAGYYKDVSLQPRLVNYIGRSGLLDYERSEPNSYEDIRGFEVTLARNVGRWVQGFVNYTYMVYKEGYFETRRLYENLTEQRNFESQDAEQRRALSKPVPRPYARINVDLLVPEGFGPELAGVHPLANWRLSLLGRWQAGAHFTWTGGGSAPGVRNNVQMRDYTNLDLRFARDFNLGGNRVQFFMDVFNVFNQRRLSFDGDSNGGFYDGQDYLDYMRSLHLPASGDYPNIPGDDQPGDYRDPDVAFQPIRTFQNRGGFGATPENGVIYYEFDTETYLQFRDGAWQQVERSRMDEILEDRAYIDNPNMSFLAFLNPRDVYFGFRISF